MYVGYAPRSEWIPVSTRWTALLNRVSLPETLSTPLCFRFCFGFRFRFDLSFRFGFRFGFGFGFRFCFCCSPAVISCGAVCVSGVHLAIQNVRPLLMRVWGGGGGLEGLQCTKRRVTQRTFIAMLSAPGLPEWQRSALFFALGT